MVLVHWLAFVVGPRVTLPRQAGNDLGGFIGLEAPVQAVMDLGAQALHISNQSAIYALAPEARSRLTTAYMVSYFLGGAVLSALTSTLYSTSGWGGVCVLGAATAGLALVIWAATATLARSRAGGGRLVEPEAGRAD